MPTYRDIHDAVIRHAVATLSPRQRYARDVLEGRQNWSGSDLCGEAKRWGGSYARQRAAASDALVKAGGCIIRVEHGRLVSAVRACVDDFGRVIYATHDGFARPDDRSRTGRYTTRPQEERAP